jgi:cysteine synthase A
LIRVRATRVGAGHPAGMCRLDDDFPTAADDWADAAIASLLAGQDAGAATPMHEVWLPGLPEVRIRLKDESAHPSGSLKHRLARSLLLHALRSGRLRPGQPIVDASSGSTAISLAWFARRLGLRFHAVMPRGTGQAKQDEVAALGGACVLVADGADTALAAARLAHDIGGCFLDQFGLAAVATDWRGDRNVAAEILAQCRALDGRDPAWIVCGAGTGGTSATLGRHLRHVGSDTRVCVADPTGAAFARGWRRRDRRCVATHATCIEGIGRRRVERCFAFDAVDAVAEVDDAASIAGAWSLERWTGRRFGGSTGTNLAAALELAAAMARRGARGTLVVLAGDRGERYADTLYSTAWLAARGLQVGPWLHALDRTARTGAATGLAEVAQQPWPLQVPGRSTLALG